MCLSAAASATFSYTRAICDDSALWIVPRPSPNITAPSQRSSANSFLCQDCVPGVPPFSVDTAQMNAYRAETDMVEARIA